MTDMKSVAGIKTTVMNSLIIHKHPLILSYHFTIMCHSSCPCSFVVMAKYRCTLPVWHSHALYMQPAPHMQPSKKVFMALSHLNIFSNRFAEYNMTILLAEKMFRNYNSSLLR
jgi:hypothetical protein